MPDDPDYTNFLLHCEAQLVSSGVPQHFWKTLYFKLKNQIFDSNDTFYLYNIEFVEDQEPELPLSLIQICCEEGVKFNDEKHIYLIDHAWTFRANTARDQLREMPGLLNRMCDIMRIEVEDVDHKVDKVCKMMWKFCQTYSVANAANIEDRVPIWYIMDEFGCGVQHSDEPNFRAVPFVYAEEQITYTLLFPVKDVNYEAIVTRDFVEGTPENDRVLLLHPWNQINVSYADFSQTEPDENYFLSGHIEESLPVSTDFTVEMPEKIKVFSEYDMVNKYLTNDRFEFTDDENSADILWYTRHFKDYFDLSLNPNRYVNQFPFENVLTIKDLLAIICRRNSVNSSRPIKPNPVWLPVTYNLKTELKKFMSYFQNRQKLYLDNHWICKPWNLARSLDTYITNNLDFILRLPVTGPKIAQKYIEHPVLFTREFGQVKFDVRYVVLLKSISPLKAYVYNNFFLRFANKPFELNNFEDYEKHFTVMNYSEETILHHLPCADFLKQWEEQYKGFPWKAIEEKILKMLKEVLENASSRPPPRGVSHSPQSRAVYAADIILSWDKAKDRSYYIQPKLLEINWTPDCKRACEYYPNFYNDIFSCLFLNDESSGSFTCL